MEKEETIINYSLQTRSYWQYYSSLLPKWMTPLLTLETPPLENLLNSKCQIRKRSILPVTSATRHSSGQVTWRVTIFPTQERKRLFAPSVARHSLGQVSWRSTCFFIKEKGLLLVTSATRLSIGRVTWRGTLLLTQEKNCLHAPSATRLSLSHMI